MNVIFGMFVFCNFASELILPPAKDDKWNRVPFLMVLYIFCSVISQTGDIAYSKTGDEFLLVRMAYILQAPVIIILSIALPMFYPGWRTEHLALVIMMQQIAPTIQYGVEANVTVDKIRQWVETAWAGASYFRSWRPWHPFQNNGRIASRY
jgi:hypothetical protein